MLSPLEHTWHCFVHMGRKWSKKCSTLIFSGMRNDSIINYKYSLVTCTVNFLLLIIFLSVDFASDVFLFSFVNYYNIYDR